MTFDGWLFQFLGKCVVLASLFCGYSAAWADEGKRELCKNAPSRSVRTAVAAGTGILVASGGTVASVAGVSAVAHSSGALILTGSAGYVAGTIGSVATAVAAAPAAIVVGTTLVGGGLALETYCLQENYPGTMALAERKYSNFVETSGKALENAANTVYSVAAEMSNRVTSAVLNHRDK